MSLKSLPPRAYAELPTLEDPAGYICVLRDIDNDNFRIEKTVQPATLINDVMEEAAGDFGIELISIAETDDLSASESVIHENHNATLGSKWLDLDPYQFAELRRSILAINAYDSLYLRPPVDSLPDDRPRSLGESRMRNLGRSASLHPSVYKTYGVQSLRRYQREAARRDWITLESTAKTWQDRIVNCFEDICVNHPKIAVAVIITVLMIVLIFAPKGRYWY